MLSEVAVVLKIRAELSVAYGKTSAEQAGRERGIFGDADFLAIKGGAFAARGGEKFVVKGIEDCGGEKRVLLGDSDRNAEARIPVGEIRGAVERINVPAKSQSRSALMPRPLFSGNSVVGKTFGQPLNDQPLRAFVRLRDKIHFVAFVRNVQRTRQFFHQDFPGFLRNFNGGFKIVFGRQEFPSLHAILQSWTVHPRRLCPRGKKNGGKPPPSMFRQRGAQWLSPLYHRRQGRSLAESWDAWGQTRRYQRGAA